MKSYKKNLLQLFSYIKEKNYEGIDLFDGLNSELFKNSPFYKNKFFRLALIQFCKRSPINFRKVLLVPDGFNPKAGALFLMGHINMYKKTKDELYKTEAQKLYQRIKNCQIKTENGIGWGYNFDWQARAFFVPENTINMVTSVYVGNALLEYHKAFNDEESLSLAEQIGNFILNEMIMLEDGNHLCFNYIPTEQAQVHNASLLGASFLSSLTKKAQNKDTRTKILKALKFSTDDIQENGAWPYGTKNFHRWVDNFHTGFNIESLIKIKENLNLDNIDITIENVINYYLESLFEKDGLPKYYDNKTYPIDIHVIAQTLITIDKIKSTNLNYSTAKMKIIEDKLEELIPKFQSKKGYFYYQKEKYFWNKIPYIRWSQAWMYYALSQVESF